jgi:tetratricopeptide (TPR) repeat protein
VRSPRYRLLALSGWLVLAIMLLVMGCSAETRKARRIKAAETYFQNGKYNEAAIEYLNALRMDPSNRTVIRQLGLAFLELGKSPQAALLLRKAADLDPNDLEVRLKLSALYLMNGLPQQARALAQDVLNKDARQLDALLLLADASREPAEMEEAVALFSGLREPFADRVSYHVALGMLYLKQKKNDQAERELKKAAEIDPQSPEVYRSLGLLHRARGNLAEAEQAFKKAFDLSPSTPSAALALVNFNLEIGKMAEAKRLLDEMIAKHPSFLPARLRMAEVAYNERRLDDCQKIIEGILQIAPRTVEAQLLKIQVLLAQNKDAEAIKACDTIATEYPNSAMLKYRLALFYLQKKDSAKAVKLLRAAVDLDPTLPDPVLLLAELDIANGNPDAAVESMQALIASRTNLVQAYVTLGKAFRAKKNPDAALEAYRKTTELAPGSPLGYYLMGLVYREMEQPIKAGEAFESALIRKPDYVAAAIQSVALDLNNNNTNKALSHVLNLINQSPNSAPLYSLLGQLYFFKKDTTNAEKAFFKSIEINPQYASAYSQLGYMYATSGQKTQALQKIETSLTISPNNAQLQMLAGMLYQENNNIDKARAYYEKVLELNPKFSAAANNLAYLCLEKYGEIDRAYELARKAREQSPDDPSIADTLGWILYKRGDFKYALELLRESAEQLPQQPDVAYHLGMTFYALGNEAEAVKSFKIALSSGKSFEGDAEAKRLMTFVSKTQESAGLDRLDEVQNTLARNPNDPSALMRLGAVYERQDDLRKAEETYQRVLILNQYNVPACTRLAEIFLSENRPDKAMEFAKRAKEQDPHNADVASVLGWAAYQSGDHQWAANLLRDAATVKGNDPETLYRLGMANYALGMVESAVAAVGKAVERSIPFKHADNAKTFLATAQLYTNPAIADTSIALIKDVLSKDPRNLPALMATATIENQRGSKDQARLAFENLLHQYPNFTPALKRLVVEYSLKPKNIDEEYKTAIRARNALPDDAEVEQALGILAYLKGDNEWALRLIEDSISKNSGTAIGYYYLGLARHRINDKVKAREALLKALEMKIDPQLAEEARRVLTVIQ